MWKYFYILLGFNSFWLNAQNISLDFEQADLTGFEQCPPGRWSLDSIHSLNGRLSLHQNYDNAEAGTDIISMNHIPLYLDSSMTTWKFTMFYNYNPSSSNMWAVWLTSDLGACLMKPDNASGYIIGVNYTGTDDMLKLWRQDENGISEVINTQFNWQTRVTSANKLAISVIRDEVGNWTIQSDSLCSGNYKFLASGKDNKLNVSDYFGVYYKYTYTQDQKLWIDDISVIGKFLADTMPPKVDSFKVVNRNTISIYLNEPVDTSKLNFNLNGSVQIKDFFFNSEKEITLTFAQWFTEQNVLNIENIKDKKGNQSEIIRLSFGYYLPHQYDVLITEILADPSPSAGLPDCEYLELLNNGFEIININSWILGIGDENIKLPEEQLKPGEYYVICDRTCKSKFITQNAVIDIANMSSLLNTGETIQLRDDFGKLIHSVNYSENWYETEYKQEGGWSLEMVDNANPCIEIGNWKESHAENGGTPGNPNSVMGIVADYVQPGVLSLYAKDSVTLCIQFSEKMDSMQLSIKENYSVTDNNQHVLSAIPNSPFFDWIELSFDSKFEKSTIYNLELESDITDCSGNQLPVMSIRFGMPVKPDSSDLIINEILYESTIYKPEFVEIFNTSDKVVDLKNFSLVHQDAYTGQTKSQVLLSEKNFQVLPYSYVVFTENKELLLEAFPMIDKNLVVQPSSWKTLVNEGSTLILNNPEGKILDKAEYNPDMHFELLNITEGISLERISPFVSGLEKMSWHSASSLVNYATPGEINSQTTDSISTDNKVSLSFSEFSPDNDGYQDYLSINYNLEIPDFTISINIFNQSGVLVNRLVNNELAGVYGTYVWDGLDANGHRLPMGYYIVYFEAVNPSGKRISEKKVVLLLPEKK